MADFSLTTLFVVPVGNTLPSSGSTQNLTAGQVGIFLMTIVLLRLATSLMPLISMLLKVEQTLIYKALSVQTKSLDVLVDLLVRVM